MELTIRKGTVADTEDFICLLQTAKASMEQQDWFFLDPAEEIRAMMHSGAMELWVAMDGDRMAAVFDFLRPGLAEYNYGYDLDFTETELMRVVQMDTAAVHPDYRGFGLQRKLMETAQLEIANEPGRILLCTIHPDNCYSMNNVWKQGYTVQKKLPKYGSVRCIMRKDLP